MESSAANMYNLRGHSKSGGTSIGGVAKNCLIWSNASCCLLPQTNSSACLSLNNGEKAFSLPVDFAINFLMKFILPIRLYNSFLFLGGLASNTVFTLFLSTSMPLWWTKKPRKFPIETPNHTCQDSSLVNASSS